MPIEYVSGGTKDLLANAHEVQALVHDCTTNGEMDVEFRLRFRAMREEVEYLARANSSRFDLGELVLWKGQGKPWIFTLATRTACYSRGTFSYEAAETALARVREQADAEGVTSMAVAPISYDATQMRPILERIFADWPGRLVVYGI
ncbi:MAG: hypothetical protein ACK4RK_13250 [Gemmataceae bacterium]